jgi:hypothetical protein
MICRWITYVKDVAHLVEVPEELEKISNSVTDVTK